MEIIFNKGGVQRLMESSILNFHFAFWILPLGATSRSSIRELKRRVALGQTWRYHRRLLDYQSPYFQLIIE